MRLLLALVAMVGLLMTPVTASVAAAACHDHGGMVMVASSKAAVEAHTVHAADHSCCDDGDAAPAHDRDVCAQACAAMCAPAATLAEARLDAPSPMGRQHLHPAPARPLHAHAPPGLKRPPRPLA